MILVFFQLSEASVEVAKVDGDIDVAGLFEVQANDGGQCGAIDVDSVMTLEATRWYLEQLNINNALPFKIGKYSALNHPYPLKHKISRNVRGLH